MSVFSKEILDVGSDGQGLNNTLPTANTIHTVPADVWDEVWLYAVNNVASSCICTVIMDNGNTINTTLSGNSGLVLVVPGLIFTSGQTIKAFANSSVGYVNVFGFANRISNTVVV